MKNIDVDGEREARYLIPLAVEEIGVALLRTVIARHLLAKVVKNVKRGFLL